MNKYIKQFIILLIVFLVILWLQKNDDKKKNKQRNDFYDQYKIPILVTSIVGLFLNMNYEKVLSSNNSFSFNNRLNVNPNASINKFLSSQTPYNQQIYLGSFD